jgi:hypothetical protein
MIDFGTSYARVIRKPVDYRDSPENERGRTCVRPLAMRILFFGSLWDQFERLPGYDVDVFLEERIASVRAQFDVVLARPQMERL